MAFPLGTILATAPGLISAAADIIRLARQKKSAPPQEPDARIDALGNLIEQQAKIIEELALNNRNMVLAVRNNRIISIASLTIALISVLLTLLN